MLFARYGCSLETVYFIVDEDAFEEQIDTRIPAKKPCMADSYGLVYSTNKRLTIPQREGAATLAWTLERYIFAVHQQSGYVLPTIFNEARAKSPDYVGIPWQISTESKAYRLAAYIEARFYTEARVVAHGDEYFVSVVPNAEFESGDSLATLEYVLWMLERFDITPSSSQDIIPMFEEEDSSNEQLALDLAVRIGRQATHQRNVEQQLDRILSHLDRNAATSAKTPATPSVKGRHLDRKRDTKKSKPAPAVDVFAEKPVKNIKPTK